MSHAPGLTKANSAIALRGWAFVLSICDAGISQTSAEFVVVVRGVVNVSESLSFVRDVILLFQVPHMKV